MICAMCSYGYNNHKYTASTGVPPCPGANDNTMRPPVANIFRLDTKKR
jgi:hypothetical protein